MIQLVGDIALTGLYVDDSQNNSKRIAEILPFFQNDALKFANLEAPIFIENQHNPHKNKIHTTNKNALKDVLIPLNIDAVSLANNHIYDCLEPGLIATIEALDELGIQYTGAGTKPEHIQPLFFEKNGKSIAFMAYVDLSTNPKTESFDTLFINYFEIEKVLNDIQTTREKADIIICSIHWGVDYSYYPTPKQRDIAKLLIDRGASIIMGHHPHTMQPYEKYDDGHILYSLGGLTFGDYVKKNNQYGALYRKTKTGLIATVKENNRIEFQNTFEKIGNYIVPSKMNFTQWNGKKWRIYKLSEKSNLILKIRKFNEKVCYRIYEYFFGYYQNPVKRLFQLGNLRKLKKILK